MFIYQCYFSNFNLILLIMITVYSTFNIASLSYVNMSYFSVCILSASEWIISRFMSLYKCTYYYCYMSQISSKDTLK